MSIATKTAMVVLAAAILGVAGAAAHGYVYDASFMQVPDGTSGYEVDTCKPGDVLYFGYAFMPTQAVHRSPSAPSPRRAGIARATSRPNCSR